MCIVFCSDAINTRLKLVRTTANVCIVLVLLSKVLGNTSGYLLNFPALNFQKLSSCVVTENWYQHWFLPEMFAEKNEYEKEWQNCKLCCHWKVNGRNFKYSEYQETFKNQAEYREAEHLQSQKLATQRSINWKKHFFANLKTSGDEWT